MLTSVYSGGRELLFGVRHVQKVVSFLIMRLIGYGLLQELVASDRGSKRLNLSECSKKKKGWVYVFVLFLLDVLNSNKLWLIGPAVKTRRKYVFERVCERRSTRL